MITATRFHDFSAGHRVVGHESKCRYLHGHNYRIHFTVGAPHLDTVGRVLDFSAIKDRLCQWLEAYWDHSFLVWENDPWLDALHAVSTGKDKHSNGILVVPFNPTAENMAHHLLTVVGPQQLRDLPGLTLVKVVVEETRKCSATAEWPFITAEAVTNRRLK